MARPTANYIIIHLQERYRAGAGPNQAYRSYYYYGDDQEESIKSCVGYIIYLFADVEFGYTTAVANECRQPRSTARAADRWNNLVLGQATCMKGTYFICIDGCKGKEQTDAKGATLISMV